MVAKTWENLSTVSPSPRGMTAEVVEPSPKLKRSVVSPAFARGTVTPQVRLVPVEALPDEGDTDGRGGAAHAVVTGAEDTAAPVAVGGRGL